MSAKENVHILTDPVEKLACHKCGQRINVRGAVPFSSVTCPQCQTPTPVPAQLGSFLLFKELGKGAMGAVYQAFDSTLKRHVAIKVLHRSLGEDTAFVKQFMGEARALAALNHPNVVQIYSCGKEKGQPYIVMELVPGGRVDTLMKKGPLDEAHVLQIALDVARGLQAAQQIGLTHGDIKPENILFGRNGAAKVVDFGLANLARGDQKSGEIWGTPFYIAPEKVRGKEGNQQSDIYSLGASLFHVLANQPPFDAPNPMDVVMARLKAPAPDIRSLRNDLHPGTAECIARMLEAEPGQRYPNYESLLSDLQGAQQSAALPLTDVAPKKSRSKTPLIAAIVAALLAAGLIAALTTKKKEQPIPTPSPIPATAPPVTPAVPAAPPPVGATAAPRPAPAPPARTREFTLPLTAADADFILTTADGNGADAHIQGRSATKDNAEATFGAEKDLWVKSETSDSLHLARKIFLRFDLRNTDGAAIRDATLRMTIA